MMTCLPLQGSFLFSSCQNVFAEVEGAFRMPWSECRSLQCTAIKHNECNVSLQDNGCCAKYYSYYSGLVIMHEWPTLNMDSGVTHKVLFCYGDSIVYARTEYPGSPGPWSTEYSVPPLWDHTSSLMVKLTQSFTKNSECVSNLLEHKCKPYVMQMDHARVLLSTCYCSHCFSYHYHISTLAKLQPH